MPLKIAPVIRVATSMRLAFLRARDRAANQMNPTRFVRQGVVSISRAEHSGLGLHNVSNPFARIPHEKAESTGTWLLESDLNWLRAHGAVA